MISARKSYELIEHDQSFWDLTCIQGASLGLPVMLIGGELAEKYGSGTAFLSICIGNLILWMISLAIISMSISERRNAIQNVEVYLGKVGALIAAIVLIVAFLDWYVLQITAATDAIDSFFQNNEFWKKEYMSIRLGIVLGFFVALLSLGGIKLIKKISRFIFPLLLFYLIYSILKDSSSIKKFRSSWHFSLPAVMSVVSIILPGTINLPTFFRHARSRGDSFLALTLITLSNIAFQTFPIIKGLTNLPDIFGTDFLVLALFFIILSLVSINLVNIYFASASVEMIFPHLWHSKEYAIVGLLGTTAFSFFQISKPVQFLENLANNFIASLGVVLLLTFILKIIVKHRPRFFEKLIGLICWFIGCTIALILSIESNLDASQILIMGMVASTLSFLVVIFIEESIWASKNVLVKPTKK